MKMLLDLYNRPIYNLRISVTSKCNLRCFYCHSEGVKNKDNRLMSIDEITTLARLAVSYGVKTIKLTGGEPLCREDITDIVKALFSIEGLAEISMVTNGYYLDKYAQRLKDAGLKRVNVSLPTLDPEKFKKITGGELQPVVAGIKSAVAVGLNPVKINMVLLKGINDDEVDSMINFSAKAGVILQLIELEPVRVSSTTYRKYHEQVDSLEEKLARSSKAIYLRGDMHKRKIFEMDSTKVEVVHPIENTEFCYNCSRLRITYDGHFKPCLMKSDDDVDTRKYLENGDYDGLRNAFLQAVLNRRPFCIR